MSEFKSYHPFVNLIYFVSVIGFSSILLHPACLFASLVCSVAYSIVLNGGKAVKFTLLYMLPLLIVSAVMNPAFNHEGVTVLTYLKSGNPLTLESIIYGLAAACTLVSVISWFACFNEIMTSDKFMYLFGKILPSLSLIISMALRFVPKFKTQMKEVADAQRCVGRGVSDGGVVARAKNGIKILSIMLTRCLENSVETADSMKARGYGLPDRTAFSNYRFTPRDAAALGCLAALALCTLLGFLSGKLYFSCFPRVKVSGISLGSVGASAAYFALCALPIILEVSEALKWRALKSKI